MKTQTLLFILFAALIGLFAGYLLFGGSGSPVTEEHDHPPADEQAQSKTGEIWTCSMHPQIQRDEPGDCPICGMDLIPTTTSAATDPTVLTMSEAAVAMARVRTTVVGSSDSPLSSPIQLTGRLALDETGTTVQSVNYGGRLERLLLTYPGETVRAGQRIATIYSPELVVAQEELLEAGRLASLSPELTVAARNKLRNLKISAGQIARLEETGEVITEFPVYAERGGTVMEIRARVGDYVTTGATLYTLSDLDKLWALFDAYERNLAEVRVGDKVSFTVVSLPGETFTGRVGFIDPLIDPATRTASIRAEVGNRGGRLKPEMFISGTIASSADERKLRKRSADELLSVPKTAVMWTGERSVVYVAVPDSEVPSYQFREVTLGESTGSGYLVTSGLTSGERVVTNGVFQLDAAAQLNNQASMMNRRVTIRGRDGEDATALTVPDFREETPELFREQLAAVVNAYLPLKERMITSQPADETQLQPLKKAITGVDMALLPGDAHLYWMRQLKALNTHLGGVTGASSVEAQRQQFGFLSQALIDALTAFGVEEKLFVQHCPMAFDGVGGNWLSEEAAIRNPFYGETMLTCGSTTDTLSPVL